MENFSKDSNYKIIEKLGQGAFGSAYKVINIENDNIYVIKQISLKNAKKEELESIEAEAKTLSSIKNENIVSYYDSFKDNDSFNIVMEFCDGLDLRKFINEHQKSKTFIDEKLIINFVLDICSGLKEIHGKNLIHRDLKPDNLFITGDDSIKIGDFGISKQLKSKNEYAKTRIGTMLYMAPEIINKNKYNKKVDIWSLGCIIHELCTLNYCFNGDSLLDLIENISKSNHERIDQTIYSKDLQQLIDLLLNVNYKERPDVNQVINFINIHFHSSISERRTTILENDEAYQNYLIEKSIQFSLDQIHLIVLNRESKYCILKQTSGHYAGVAISYVLSGILSGGLGIAVSSGVYLISFILSLIIAGTVSKPNFIKENIKIIKYIENKVSDAIRNRMKEKIKIQKIIIYNTIKFEKKIEMIKNRLISAKYITKLKKLMTKNFNVLLVGCTNVGKSTLINEFLKLEKDKRAKESEGGPTDTIDFTPYIGTRNKNNYTLYDTNGITNDGENSIENKIKNTIQEINNRISSQDPNLLIHCIWYCVQGSNIQPSDGKFINELLNIYTTYSIPIIFVHTQTYSKS